MAKDLVTGGYAPETGYGVSRKIEVAPRESAKAKDARKKDEREFAETFAETPAEQKDFSPEWYELDKKRGEIELQVGFFETLVDFGENKAAELGIDFRVTSLCLWFGGNTKPYKEWLKVCGCRWSAKRQAWYWRIPQAA